MALATYAILGNQRIPHGCHPTTVGSSPHTLAGTHSMVREIHGSSRGGRTSWSQGSEPEGLSSRSICFYTRNEIYVDQVQCNWIMTSQARMLLRYCFHSPNPQEGTASIDTAGNASSMI